MKIEDIAAAINFSEIKDDFGNVHLYGQLEIGEKVTISGLLKDRKRAIDVGKKDITRAILVKLYEDRRREVAQAFQEFLKVQPFQWQEMEDARNRVMKAANFTPLG